MRCLLLFPLAWLVGLAACQPADTGADKARKLARVPTPAPQIDSLHCRQEILDPEFNHMVAFSLKVPRDWQVEQKLEREWYGKAPRIKIWIRLRSPDGRQQIDYYPSQQYAYSERSKGKGAPPPKQPGAPDSQFPNETWEAMTPAAYLRKQFLPELVPQELALGDTNNLRLPPPHLEEGLPMASASLDGTLPNGRRARAEVRMRRKSVRSGAITYHMWSAVPSLTQAVGQLAATYAHTQAAQQSIRQNPEWVRRVGEPVADSISSDYRERFRIIDWQGRPVSNTMLYYYHLMTQNIFETRKMHEDLMGHRYDQQAR